MTDAALDVLCWSLILFTAYWIWAPLYATVTGS